MHSALNLSANPRLGLAALSPPALLRGHVRRLLVTVATVVAFGTLIGPAVGAPEAKWHASLGAWNAGQPAAAGPSDEAARVEVTTWAQSVDALAQTFDAATGETSVLLSRAVDLPPLSGAPQVKVTVAPFPRARYEEAMAFLTARSWSAAAAKFTYGAWLSAESGRIVVETSAPADVLKPLIQAFPGIFEFENSTGPVAEARNADSAPHYGGARLTTSGGSNPCTAGPNIRIGATAYGTAAGHCGPNGTTWVAGPYPFGYTNARPNFPTTDVERITSSSYANRLYYGGTTTTSTLQVVGAGNPSGAIVVSTSGGISGTTSGTVTALNVVVCINPEGCTYNVFTTNNNHTTTGDSGAPVHTVSGGSAGVRGIHIGASPIRQYVQSWNSVASALGASILT